MKLVLAGGLIFIQHIGFYEVVFENRHPLEIIYLLYVKQLRGMRFQ